METFGRLRHAWLNTFLALPGGIPSHDTFRRVFGLLDRRQFSSAWHCRERYRHIWLALSCQAWTTSFVRGRTSAARNCRATHRHVAR